MPCNYLQIIRGERQDKIGAMVNRNTCNVFGNRNATKACANVDKTREFSIMNTIVYFSHTNLRTHVFFVHWLLTGKSTKLYWMAGDNINNRYHSSQNSLYDMLLQSRWQRYWGKLMQKKIVLRVSACWERKNPIAMQYRTSTSDKRLKQTWFYQYHFGSFALCMKKLPLKISQKQSW